MDNSKDILEVIFKIISILVIGVGFLRFLYLRIYQESCKSFYGVDGDNFKVLREYDRNTLNLIITQIIVIFSTLYIIYDGEHLLGKKVICVIAAVIIIAMIIVDYKIYSEFKEKTLLIIDLVIFFLFLLFGIAIFSINKDFKNIDSYLVIEFFVLIGLFLISVSNLFSPFLYDPKYKKDYEILKFLDASKSDSVDDIYVKLDRNDDGFLIAKGKILENSINKLVKSEVIEGSKKGSFKTETTPIESKKVLYIYRNDCRYADPKLFSIKNYKFDEVEVKDPEEVQTIYTEDVQKDEEKKDEK
ncbi:hypothetical protein [uncultured Anaerococcus sp.]|uniref:hypothetical protein n=1 Tax=uncultured Anaerococcus sp. TaxID=293428 RepID=UPI00260AC547|nr:hypothetical protein [uncultured Anaerococcus sp.]